VKFDDRRCAAIASKLRSYRQASGRRADDSPRHPPCWATITCAN